MFDLVPTVYHLLVDLAHVLGCFQVARQSGYQLEHDHENGLSCRGCSYLCIIL